MLAPVRVRHIAMAPEVDRKLFVLPNNTPVVKLSAKKAFEALSPKVAIDTAKFTEDEYTALLVYIAGFIANGGNYKGFGDSKIVPDVPKDKLETLLKVSAAWAQDAAGMAKIWAEVAGPIFDLSPHRLNLGFGTATGDQKPGITTYLSSNISKTDAELVDRFMAQEGLEAWNTRLFKTDKGGKPHFEIRLASVEEKVVSPSKEFEEATIEVKSGDYSPLLKRLVAHLTTAKTVALTEQESAMTGKYIEHFNSGCIKAHKDGSRHWIKDVGPVVESYIGFIENYRDPAGTRSEFEGFVAAVDKATSAKFGTLVSKAEELLKRLPWGPDYEKDAFLKPDFTSLDILAFGSSGVPAGINIPNYDDIRQSEGFKNVSLGNVIASTPKLKLNFLSAEDDVLTHPLLQLISGVEALFRKWHSASFEVQVGLHELLGHGSGKLFIRSKDGSFNFDKSKVKDILTGEEVKSWYEEGETWGSKFGALASAYEECRAEAVGYVLCCDPDILEIFGYKKEDADAIKYMNWLSEIRAGLMALEFYSTETKAWGQAHCYARYVLTEVVLRASQGFVKVEEVTGEDGKPDLLFTLDKSKIDTVGKPATQEFLKKLQAYKTTGDVAGGRALFESYGTPTEQALKWRAICVARRQPRRLFVQANTKITNGSVELVEYPETPAGLIQSSLERYDPATEAELLCLAAKDKPHFQY